MKKIDHLTELEAALRDDADVPCDLCATVGAPPHTPSAQCDRPRPHCTCPKCFGR